MVSTLVRASSPTARATWLKRHRVPAIPTQAQAQARLPCSEAQRDRKEGSSTEVGKGQKVLVTLEYGDIHVLVRSSSYVRFVKLNTGLS